MAWFSREKPYDRSRILDAATRARRRGRRRKAIELYQRVLKAEPGNPDIERRIAPLFAETKRPDEAWRSYCRAASNLAKRGFVDRAIGVFRDATRYLADREELWRSIADLEVERGRTKDALSTLLEARRKLRRRSQRPAAIRLLEHGYQIDPRHFETSYELAWLLALDGARPRARRLLADLALQCRGSQLRRVRLRQLRIDPTPAALWRWLRALLGIR